MRATTIIFLTTAVMGLGAGPSADAATTRRAANLSAAPAATDLSAQQRRRPRVRIYRSIDERGVYPSYFPGSNAVRDCTASYAQEFRPSGTVIVPRMSCFWRQP